VYHQSVWCKQWSCRRGWHPHLPMFSHVPYAAIHSVLVLLCLLLPLCKEKESAPNWCMLFSQMFSIRMHKTGCSGQTRLVLHVPSPSWAGEAFKLLLLLLLSNCYQSKYCFAGRLHCTDWVPECPASGLCAGFGHDAEGNGCLFLLPSASAFCHCLNFLPLDAILWLFFCFLSSVALWEWCQRSQHMSVQSQNSLLSTHLYIICHAGLWKVLSNVAQHHKWHTMCAVVLCHMRLVHLFSALHCGGLCQLPCLCQPVSCHTWQALDWSYWTWQKCDLMPHQWSTVP